MSFYFTSFICGCSCKVSTKVQSKNRNGPSSYLLKWIIIHFLFTFFKLLINSLTVHFPHLLIGPSVMLLFLTKKHVDFYFSSKKEAKNSNGPSRYILKWTTSHYLFIHSIKLKLTSIWVNTFAVHIFYLFYDWLSFYFTRLICGCSCKVSTKVQSKNINGPSSYILKGWNGQQVMAGDLFQ